MLRFKNDKLPDLCFVFIPGNAPGSRIGVVHLGHCGYWPSSADVHGTMTEAAAREYVRKLNREAGITALQEDCMMNGSLFGWSVPAADPEYMMEKHGADAYTEGGAERAVKA
jgi:hypothetical protein